ncbi:MAG: PAS domain-containing protein [Oligoflexales bacterium]|nr:PAS domain-containing protein [Oligoflexales bacterium]
MPEKKSIKSAANIANALTRIRLGDFTVRLPNSGNAGELSLIVDQINELAASLQSQTYTKTQSLLNIRVKIFHFCALAAILLPLLIVIISYFLNSFQQPTLLVCAIVVATGSAVNYAIYLHRKNLKSAFSIHIVISLISYSAAIFASGDTKSEIIIFAPLVVLIAGLLAGKIAVILSALSLGLVLAFSEIYQLLVHSVPLNSLTPLFINISGLGTIAGLFWLFEQLEKIRVSSLAAMNAALVREKVLNDQIIQALNASAIVAITDTTGKITQVNENFCRISGYSESELLGQNHRLINSGQHTSEFFVDLWRTIRAGNVWTGEIQNRSKSGAIYFVQTVITPLKNQEGKIERYLAIRFDVTKEREVSQQLAEAQRVAKIGSWSYGRDGGSAFWSRQMFELHNEDLTKPAPNLKQHLEFVHPEDRTLWQDQIGECFQFGKPCKLRFRIISKTGRLVWLETLTEIESNHLGQVIKVRGTSQDVTDMVRAEQAIKREQSELKARQNLLDNVLGNIPSIIFVKNFRNELRYEMINRASEKLLEITNADIIGKTDFDIFSKEQAEAYNSDDMAAFEKKEILNIDCHTIDTPRGQRLLSTIKVPTFDEDGKPELLIGISEDITDDVRIKAELEIERAKFVQASKLASLGEMSAGIAHEINNPLTIIAGTVRALPKFISIPEEFEERIQTVNKSVERIGKIVSGLRKYSRTAESTEMKMHSIGDIVKEALILTNAKSRRHNVSLELDADSKKQLFCNEIEIEQVLVNLINNSIDAVKDLSDRWIKIRVYEEDKQTVLEVRDSGALIKSEYREKLFQPFYTTKPVGEGTGLGLAIVKGILDEHNAKISIRTDLATTCFVIHFQKFEEAKNVV